MAAWSEGGGRMNQIVLVTGASSGFGRMIANELAGAGHIVYGSMRGLSGKNAHQVADIAAYSQEHGVDLGPRAVPRPARVGCTALPGWWGQTRLISQPLRPLVL